MWVYVIIHKQHVLSMWTHMNSLKSSLEGEKKQLGNGSCSGGNTRCFTCTVAVR